MNRSIRTLVLAAPLASAALMVGTVSAQAEPKGPTVLSLPGHVDPEPHPQPLPQGPGDIALPEPGPVGPQGPGDLTNPEPGPVGPQGPGDLTNPEPGPVVNPDLPQGPDDLTAPEQCPTHGEDCTPDDEPADESAPEVTPDAEVDLDREIPTPTRIDAGEASSEGGLDIAWLVAGGLAVTVLGAAGAGYRYLESRA